MLGPEFTKSSYSGTTCVEVALLPDGQVAVRNPKMFGSLIFTGPEWQAFIAGVKNDEFDYPSVA